MISARTVQTCSRSGISLIEIMFSFLILVLATLSASGVISYGVRGTKADFRQIEATQLLIDRMNELTSLPFATLNSFIDAGSNETTLTEIAANIEFGDSIAIGSNNYRVHATIKRQTIEFESLMELDFPNPVYNPEDPATWNFKDRGSVAFNGTANPYLVIKTTVVVQPVGGVTEEREFQAISFVVDLES